MSSKRKGQYNRMVILSFSEIDWLKKKMKGTGTLGGIETNHKNLMAGLKRRGHVIIENRQMPEGLVPDIIICPTFGPQALLNIWQKKKIYNCACVQHAHTTPDDLQGGFLPNGMDPLMRIYLRQLYRFSDILITPSNFSKQSLLNLKIPTGVKIIPVSNGVDLQRFKFSDEKRANFKAYLQQKFNIDPNKPLVLCVGVIWARKGIDVFHAVAKALPNYHFIWVGNVLTAKELVGLYNDLPNLTFTGFVDDIVGAYCGADVFFFPSRAENQGIPLLEAAACKLPILCRDLPTYDWLENGVHCIKEKTIYKFKNELVRIVEDKKLRESLVIRALNNVQQHDLERIIDTVEAIYWRAIKLRKKVLSLIHH